MEVKSKVMGPVSVSEKQLIKIPQGLYGFENNHSFALIEAPQKPFLWLQSLEDENLSFLLINPFIFRADYELDIDDKDLEIIKIKDPKDAIILVLVTVKGNGEPITANLQGPLVINKENNLAVQAVLADSRWTTKHDIMVEMKQGSSTC